MYVKHDGTDIVIMVIQVDDIVVVSSNVSMLDEVKAMLSKKFKVKDQDLISRFLGIDFKAILQWVMKLSVKVLQRFSMTKNVETLESKKWREAIGCLIYAMTCTGQEILWIVTK